MAEQQWPNPGVRVVATDDARLDTVTRALARSTGMDEQHRAVWSYEARAVLAALDDLAQPIPGAYRVVQHPTCSLDEAEGIHDGHVDEEGT